MRKCYSAPAQFFADDTSRGNRINWYFVPDDALIYDQPTVFTPGIDNPDWTKDNLPEHVAERTTTRKYNSGVNLWGTTGAHVDGDVEDFLGQAPSTKYAFDGNAPVNPCGLIRNDFIGLVFNSETLYTSGKYPVDRFGLKLGTPPELYYDGMAGLHFGLIETVLKPSRATDAMGLHLGLWDSSSPPLPVYNLVGLHLGLIETVLKPSRATDAMGLHLGLWDSSSPPLPVYDRVGLHFGLIETVLKPSRATDAMGLHLGLWDSSSPPLPVYDLVGLHLGLVETVLSPAEATDALGLYLGYSESSPGPSTVAGCFGCALSPEQWAVSWPAGTYDAPFAGGFFNLEYVGGAPGCQWSYSDGLGNTLTLTMLSFGQSFFVTSGGTSVPLVWNCLGPNNFELSGFFGRTYPSSLTLTPV